MLEQGEILLLPIPFTDLKAAKRRPVLVLSNERYNSTHEDILVAAITSNVSNEEYGVLLEQRDLVEGALPRVSMVRFDKLYCISQRIVVKRFGRLANQKYKGRHREDLQANSFGMKQ